MCERARIVDPRRTDKQIHNAIALMTLIYQLKIINCATKNR